MSPLRRFPLHYDEEFDRDIHELLTRTPEKRRSERIRNLIRLGLAKEESQTGQREAPMPRTVPPVRAAAVRNELRVSAEQQPVRFEPPS